MVSTILKNLVKTGLIFNGNEASQYFINSLIMYSALLFIYLMLFVRMEQDFSQSQIHFIIISRDSCGPTGSNITCVHLLTQAECKLKDSSIQPKYIYYKYIFLICRLSAPVFANP